MMDKEVLHANGVQLRVTPDITQSPETETLAAPVAIQAPKSANSSQFIPTNQKGISFALELAAVVLSSCCIPGLIFAAVHLIFLATIPGLDPFLFFEVGLLALMTYGAFGLIGGLFFYAVFKLAVFIEIPAPFSLTLATILGFIIPLICKKSHALGAIISLPSFYHFGEVPYVSGLEFLAEILGAVIVFIIVICFRISLNRINYQHSINRNSGG